MIKKILFLLASILLIVAISTIRFEKKETRPTVSEDISMKAVKKKKKTPEERMLFSEERLKHELAFQTNPLTGKIPLEEKKEELRTSLSQGKLLRKTTSSNYISRGPSNLGGRTRAIVIDISDNTSKTMIAGGVSSGVFRTTDGGASWTKVSSNSEIHNVTAIAQDPRPGFQNIWYYATGERLGNSTALGSFYFGQGIWKSTNNGQTWSQIPITNSDHTRFDSNLDLISAIEVNPLNGDLIIAAHNKIFRYNGTSLIEELTNDGGSGMTDVVISSTGRVYTTFSGDGTNSGVWTSSNGNGSWTQIAKNGLPTGWSAAGRIVLGISESNNNIVYALYDNGKSNVIEADLWRYNHATTTWTNFSSKLPDEPGGDKEGNDPFAIQGGYDLVVSVKPDNENFVVIGGTNIYKIDNINTSTTFTRIGGYKDNTGYSSYNMGGIKHHPDIHALIFDPGNSKTLISGTDGGIHKTDVTSANVAWESLNNNYQTYQYYHVAMDSYTTDMVIGGAQDNGTTIGGLDFQLPSIASKTQMLDIVGGDGVAVGLGRNTIGDYRLYLGFQNGTIYRFKSGYEDITPKNSESQFVTYFYLDPDNNNAMYYAGLNKLYMTKDTENVTTTTWTNLGSVSTSESFRTFATTRGTYSSQSSYLFIGGSEGGVFRLKNPQNATSLSTAVNITPSSATIGRGTIVSGIAVHPTNPNIVMVVYANYGINNIYLTTNATASTPTWTLVERNLNSHSIRSVAITEVGGETIYFVGTARGLFSSADPKTKNWDIEGANTIGYAVVSSLVYRPADNKLLIGTHGNGMFETTVKGTLSSNDYATNSLGLKLYPNPTVDKINIQSSLLASDDKIEYQIYDVRGKSIKSGRIINQQVDVQNLESGVYIINVTAQGKKQSLKFVKQ